MTTDIRIRTNGNYTAEGTLTIKRDGIEDEIQTVYVTGAGQSSPVEKQFNVPHGSIVVLQIAERPASEDELHANANGDEGNTGEHDDVDEESERIEAGNTDPNDD